MRPASPAEVEAALRSVTVWPPDLAPDARYQPLPDLVAGGLAARICARLGDPPLRVGQSAVVMGLASRLWSVLVVPAVRHRVLPDPSELVGRDEAGSLVLGVRRPVGGLDPSVNDVAAAVHRVLDPLLGTVPLASRLVWGNAAASLHAVPRVHGLPEARALVDELLARPPYDGELDVLPDGRARRRTCCLFYLVEGAALCGDCAFDSVPARDADPLHDGRRRPPRTSP
jgi:hypothetical protein